MPIERTGLIGGTVQITNADLEQFFGEVSVPNSTETVLATTTYFRFGGEPCKKCLSLQPFTQYVNCQVGKAATVSPFIVIPGKRLYHSAVNHHSAHRIKY